jgi:peptide-methionine (S)-S-oxide reductase
MRGTRVVAIAVPVVVVTAVLFLTAARARDAAVPLPAPTLDPASTGPETAVLAGGCFWGIQAVFEHVGGVTLVVAGYAGGAKVNPTYEEVSTEKTGHAESVRITYDASKVSFGKLMQVFFSVGHDPTQLNRQGPDEGPSYRSNIFYTSDSQRKVAEAYIAQLTNARLFSRPIVTRVDPFTNFYPAEDYHQDFLIKNPSHPYIIVNDLPKLSNFKRLLPELYRDQPVKVDKRVS